MRAVTTCSVSRAKQRGVSALRPIPTGITVAIARFSASHATVDGQPGAGDELGGVGAQEHDDVGHVADLAEASRRGQRDDIGDRRFG